MDIKGFIAVVELYTGGTIWIMQSNMFILNLCEEL